MQHGWSKESAETITPTATSDSISWFSGGLPTEASLMTANATGAVTDFGTRLLAAFQPQNGASTSILIAEKEIPKTITNSRARQFARIKFPALPNWYRHCDNCWS
jgi:hypothetical protein